MERIEMVEKLQQKATVTMEEAKTVLESCNWDLLDAMILLEKDGKVKTSGAHGSSVREEPVCTSVECTVSDRRKRTSSGESVGRRFKVFLKKLLRKGMDNRFVVRREGAVIVDIPVLLAVILILAFFWLAIILLIAGLFKHCEYSFTGADLGKDSINDSIRKATDAAQNFAEQVTGRQQSEQ